jgi:hypothetical protein
MTLRVRKHFPGSSGLSRAENSGLSEIPFPFFAFLGEDMSKALLLVFHLPGSRVRKPFCSGASGFHFRHGLFLSVLQLTPGPSAEYAYKLQSKRME